jgi:hypothetical protein
MATTGICDSFKNELLQGGHCFLATQSSLAGAGASGAFTLTGLASTAGVAVGMAAGGTNVGTGAIVSAIQSATAVTVSVANSGTVTSGTISFTGDAFKFLLIKVGPTRTFDHTQTNVGTPGSGSPTATNVGTDEVAATGGYSSGGQALTNVSPVLSSTTACCNFSPSPSYTGATISTTAGIIYNTSTRLGAGATPLNGRTCSVHDFGGTQTVTSGTITFTMPAQTAGNAIIQLA